jgi:hypothetical protein
VNPEWDFPIALSPPLIKIADSKVSTFENFPEPSFAIVAMKGVNSAAALFPADRFVPTPIHVTGVLEV